VSDCVAFGFDMAGGALGGAARHLDIFGLPVDLQVMVAKPVIPQDHNLLAWMSACKLGVLGVVVIM
jgi:hypothetical protein